MTPATAGEPHHGIHQATRRRSNEKHGERADGGQKVGADRGDEGLSDRPRGFE
jgi:hypothetical protein